MIKEGWVLKDSRERWVWKEGLDQLDVQVVLDHRYGNNRDDDSSQSDCIIQRVQLVQ